MAELWGLAMGLELAWYNGIKNLVVECDSMLAVRLITHGCSLTHPYSNLVSHIRQLQNRSWNVQLVKFYREANGVADWLAANGHDHAVGTRIFTYPPNGCSSLVLRDLMGVAYARRIVV